MLRFFLIGCVNKKNKKLLKILPKMIKKNYYKIIKNN